MPAGEAFSQGQSDEIDRAIRHAEAVGGLAVSVYVGELSGDSRAAAQSLHDQLEQPLDRVLVAVDPGSRRLEIVTGAGLAHRLDDRACALASASMISAFAGGDLAGGIATGVAMLGEHARHPRTLHTDA